MIKDKKVNYDKPVIDITGPEGNAFALMGRVKGLVKQIDNEALDADAIKKEMMEGDYENLIHVFDLYFGDYVDLER